MYPFIDFSEHKIYLYVYEWVKSGKNMGLESRESGVEYCQAISDSPRIQGKDLLPSHFQFNFKLKSPQMTEKSPKTLNDNVENFSKGKGPLISHARELF